jgi:hypothetical protein
MGRNDRDRAGRRRGARTGVVASALITLTGCAATAAQASPAPPTTQPPRPSTTATPAPPPSLPEPESEEADPARTLVPSIVVAPGVLETVEQRRPIIVRALDENRNAVAVEEGPGTLCAVVPILAPVMVAGRWERNGEPIAASDLRRRNPPGYGECINNDGEPFDAGVYQYVAVGQTGATSAAVTLVVGSTTVALLLVNNGTGAVCQIHVSPRQADLYEAFEARTGSPLRPGEAIAIRVADVEQDVRVFGCPVDDELTTFRVEPQAQTYVDMFDAEGSNADATPAPTATGPSTSATPPTTTTS